MHEEMETNPQMGVDTCSRVPMTQSEEIEETFTYHSPKPGQSSRYEEIRAQAKCLAHFIAQNTPPSKERMIAIQKLQEAVMFANAAIAIHE